MAADFTPESRKDQEQSTLSVTGSTAPDQDGLMKITADLLQSDHTTDAIARRLATAKSHSYLGDFVLGAVDGGVTTFAIVAGAAGAGLSNGIVLVLGLANVLADGFSMAAGNFLRARSDQQVLQRFRLMEETHIERIPDGEREEIRQIFRGKGFNGEMLERVVQVITEDRQRWVNTMLTDEWGLQLQPPSPWRAAVATLAAFILAGLIPLAPMVVLMDHRANESFGVSAMLTGATFFAIGVVRGRVADQRPLASGLETFLIGGSAALVAFLVGWLLQGRAAH
jgi:vacuolar iron transporter family protein